MEKTHLTQGKVKLSTAAAPSVLEANELGERERESNVDTDTKERFSSILSFVCVSIFHMSDATPRAAFSPNR
jgi:hypothetical protein